MELDAAIESDTALAEAAFSARFGLLRQVTQRLSPLWPEPILPRSRDALLRVPRERFVLPEDIALSADDAPLPLDREGLATVSAPHAYLLTYALLQLGEGDHLIELGTGTGYGAAIARAIVGPAGRVDSIEIAPDLAVRARRLIRALQGGEPSRITLHQGDASLIAPAILQAASTAGRPIKIAVTFAMHAPPSELIAHLPEGARLVAPVASAAHSAHGAHRPRAADEEQHLVLWEKRDGAIHASAHGAVRYVTERH
jgi:protein-L-isoaspartate(D-aspartate) O-methyltransferase